MTVAVFGASGFVGGAVLQALQDRGVPTVPLTTPRLPPVEPRAVAELVTSLSHVVTDLAVSISGCQAVVNAAGDPNASSRDRRHLVAANAALPLLVARAAEQAGVPRMVHVSSAVVQGRRPVLDETPATQPFSDYSRSKALAEDLLRGLVNPRVVIYRPPSVHSVDRRVTRSLVAVAQSPLSSVAAPGDAPTPQAHIDNVGDAVAHLAVCSEQPPLIVMHPWEGFGTADFLRLLGDREPLRVPAWPAQWVTRFLRLVGAQVPPVAANVRRLEMIWFGQGQATSWLQHHGWTPPAGKDAWTRTAKHVRAHRHTRTMG